MAQYVVCNILFSEGKVDIWVAVSESQRCKIQSSRDASTKPARFLHELGKTWFKHLSY